MATIGCKAAIAEIGKLHLSGSAFFAVLPSS
jgi:hypothetical protein